MCQERWSGSRDSAQSTRTPSAQVGADALAPVGAARTCCHRWGRVTREGRQMAQRSVQLLLQLIQVTVVVSKVVVPLDWLQGARTVHPPNRCTHGKAEAGPAPPRVDQAPRPRPLASREPRRPSGSLTGQISLPPAPESRRSLGGAPCRARPSRFPNQASYRLLSTRPSTTTFGEGAASGGRVSCHGSVSSP